MIATIQEVDATFKIINEEKAKLKAEKIEVNPDLQIGLNVEIPATAIISHEFAKYFDFFSIGTNDLIQYTLSADRVNHKLSHLYQPLNPALLKLIQIIVIGGNRQNIEVGISGRDSANLDAVILWVGLGVNSLSMSPNDIPTVRALIAQIRTDQAEKLAKRALECRTDTEVLKLIKQFKIDYNIN